MNKSPASIVIEAYRLGHKRILKLADNLSDDQLTWRANPNAHSLAFHLWHAARWADFMQAAIPGMTPELGRRLGQGEQVWVAQGLAVCWGFTDLSLGYSETGMEMPDDVAARLAMPSKDTLMDYVRKVFAAVDRAVDAIDEQQFDEDERPQPLTEGIWGESTVGGAIISHVIHDNRHLGMMECLLGLQTGRGTATV